MDGIDEGKVGTYRPASDSFPPPPPPYPGRNDNDFEVKIAPHQMNGEATANGTTSSNELDDRWGIFTIVNLY